MNRMRLPTVTLVSLLLGLVLHQAWLSTRDSLQLPSSASIWLGDSLQIGVEGFYPAGGELRVATSRRGGPPYSDLERGVLPAAHGSG